MRRPVLLACVLALAVLAAPACRPDRDEPARVAARNLQGVLNYPGAQVVSAEGEGDAGQLTFQTRAPADTVAAWYRVFFRLNRWELRSDQRDPATGRIVLYAEQDSAGTAIPVWVMIRPLGTGGASFDVVGARSAPADSTPAAG
ncbi:MAG: hypothetical protein ACREN5_07520, partial [Gemmatimonadales bacterium]